MDVGTVSSDAVMASYQRQLSEAHQKIALLEAALERDQHRLAQANLRAQQPDDGEVEA